MRWADHLTGLADIIGSFQDDGEVRVNIGNQADGVGYASEEPMYGPDGFVGMPNAPDDAGACQAIYLMDGDRKRVIGTRDNRWLDKVGNLKPGDRAIVTNSPARVLLKKETNTVVLYTETTDDKTMMVTLDGVNNQILAVCGNSYLTLSNDAFEVNVGGQQIRIDANGIAITGSWLAANCGGGNLGIIPGGVPAMMAATGIVGHPPGTLLPATSLVSAKWCVVAP